MATHGRLTGVIVNEHDLSVFFNSIDLAGEAELIDVTTFTAPARQYLIGYTDGKASLTGIFGSKDPAVSSDPKEVDDVLQPILGDATVDPLIVLAQEGLAIANVGCSFMQAKSVKYNVTSPINTVVSVMSEMQANEGINVGALLAHKVARTVTGQSAAYDLLAGSAKGFVSQLHAMTVGAATSVIVTIEDSADGTTGWAAIGTFASKAIAGSERISTTGTVRRFVRAKWTITGANGVTLITAFALQK